jgi:SulP family sulfate permease
VVIVAGIIHALTLLIVVLALAPMARHIPMATLAAVLFVVAWTMGEWREIAGILRLDMADKSVWLITFALTVVADLTIAVEVGMAWRRCSTSIGSRRPPPGISPSWCCACET